MEIRRIIDKIRFRLNDTDEVTRSDHEILLAINDAYRFYRDICLENNPDLIARFFRNTFCEKELFAYIPSNPVKIVEVRCNGRLIHPANLTDITNTEAMGTPTKYVPKIIEGQFKLLFFPRPQNTITYTVSYLPEIEEFEIDDDMSVSNDVISCMVDYVVARLSGVDASEIGVKIKKLVNDITPVPCVVESYY